MKDLFTKFKNIKFKKADQEPTKTQSSRKSQKPDFFTKLFAGHIGRSRYFSLSFTLIIIAAILGLSFNITKSFLGAFINELQIMALHVMVYIVITLYYVKLSAQRLRDMQGDFRWLLLFLVPLVNLLFWIYLCLIKSKAHTMLLKGAKNYSKNSKKNTQDQKVTKTKRTKDKNQFIAYNSDQEKFLYYGVSGNSIQISNLDDSKNLSQKNVLILNDHDVIAHNFELDKSIGLEELADSVEINVFQDMGLDPKIEYTIVFSYRDSKNSGKYAINAHAIPKTTLESKFSAFIDKVGYVDLALSTSILPFVLYESQLIKHNSCDVFLFFTKENLIISIFNEGLLTYSRTLNNGLNKMHESYKKNTRDNIEFLKFIEYVCHRGLDPNAYIDEQKDLFSDIKALIDESLNNANNILNYARRVAPY